MDKHQCAKEPVKIEEAAAAIADKVQVLPAWAIALAVEYFRQRLVIWQPHAPMDSDERASACIREFVTLIEGWRPDCEDFWLQCAEFNKSWAPGRSTASRASPKSRPLAAGTLTNYLARLLMKANLEAYQGDDSKDYEGDDSTEIVDAAIRFCIKVTDIRVTCESVFAACSEWTGLDWTTAGAADPCPWPVPSHFDGLSCCWRRLATRAGLDRIYLNPPWSKIDLWLMKAIVESQKGVQILAVVPVWLMDVCKSIVETASISRYLTLWVDTKILWGAEFAHPTTGKTMPPLDVTLVWIRL